MNLVFSLIFFWGNLDRVKKLKIVMLNIVIWNLKECKSKICLKIMV